MSNDQKSILQYADDGDNVFMTGAAGVGKTYVLRKVIQSMKTKHSKVAVVAPTGVAATHIDGNTIHSYFSVRINFDIKKPKKNLSWMGLKCLIIDEISLITPELFAYMEAQARHTLGTDELFGGVQLFLCGDFFQLPCIHKKQKGPTEPKYIFETKLWDELNLRSVVLTQCYRQDDIKFINFLNKIRVGQIDDSVNEYAFALQRKRIPETNMNNTSVTVLSCYRKNVQQSNANHLRSLASPSYKYKLHMVNKFQKNKTLPAYVKGKILSTLPVPEVVELKLGAQVMVCFNVSIPDKIVNGTRGVIVDFAGPYHWPHIKCDTFTFILRPYTHTVHISNIFVEVRCIPLVIAHSLTVHKAQGCSLPQVQVNLSNSFTSGQVYVALSRATNPEHLYITGWNSKKVKVCPRVQAFYSQLLSY
jgi:ATP-dependent DNA helicase PIF1